MKHLHTNELYRYWNRIRGDQTAPERNQIEPTDIRHLLKDTFILEMKAHDNYAFRLAGTRICSIFCREMKERNFLNLLDDENKEAIHTILHSTVEDASVNVIGFLAKNEFGRTMALETIFLPLSLNGQMGQRIIGSICAIKPPYWVGSYPIRTLEISSFRMILPHQHSAEMDRLSQVNNALNINRAPTTPPPSFRDARRVRHLTVLDGGASATQNSGQEL